MRDERDEEGRQLVITVDGEPVTGSQGDDPADIMRKVRVELKCCKALIAMRPPMETARPLAIFIGELLTALWQRGEAEDGERPVTDLSRRELRDALAHAKALRLLRPRQQIQVCALDLTFAVTAELEGRSGATAGHAARVARRLADDCPPGTPGKGLPRGA